MKPGGLEEQEKHPPGDLEAVLTEKWRMEMSFKEILVQ